MNEVLNTIATRSSCRAFTDQVPSDEHLLAIANAAIQAPSAMNRQPWRVIVVKDQALIRDMDDEGMRILAAMEDKTQYDRMMSRGGRLFYHAPCLVMVPVDPSNLPGAALDCGILCENVTLAAASLGMGSVICGMARLAFAGERAKEFQERLGFPEGFQFGMAVLLGYAVQAAAPHQPDLAKIRFVP